MTFLKNYYKTLICFKCQSAYVPKCIQVHKRSPFGSAAKFCLTFGVAVDFANENVSRSRSLRDFDKNAAIRGHYHVLLVSNAKVIKLSQHRLHLLLGLRRQPPSVPPSPSPSPFPFSSTIFRQNSSCPNSNSWAKRRLTTNLRI